MSIDKNKLPLNTKIGRYHVTIDTDDGESTYCHVMDNLRRPSLCASLALLEDQGGFESDNGDFIEIDQNTLRKIAAWAESTGQY